MAEARQRILTGMRPTGNLHLGHYVGALENWLRLQDEYDSFFLIADYQAMGDHIKDIQGIREAVRAVTLDWLAVGLDPHRSSFVVQSFVPEHAELHMLLSMITPLAMVERNPTLKAERKLLRDDLSLGFFNYPASQVADILLPRAHLVPVGKDQAPHVELTREIARRFNSYYGPVFPVPDILVGRVGRLVGLDGQAKMSKSLNNAIYLSDEADVIGRKVMSMYTDPGHVHVEDPGQVRGNAVFLYLDAFAPDKHEVEAAKRQYRKGGLGDVKLKRWLIEVLRSFVDPIRERRRELEAHPERVDAALEEGTARGQAVARETMLAVRRAMGIVYRFS
ncbi:MAG TPA: tryptophan--tRNA ligase [Chloroflexota bacterium]|nr:tryptophan--tRNA ligase [Chloroflexota bacterium]